MLLKKLGKEQSKSKTRRQKKIIKIRAEINKRENRKIKKINEIKSWFFKKINKIDELLLDGLRKERLKLLKSEMEVGTLILILQK